MKKEIVIDGFIKKIEVDYLEGIKELKEFIHANKVIYVNQVLQVPVTNGVSFHSSNNIAVDSIELTPFNDTHVLNINNYKLSISFDSSASVEIRNRHGWELELFFKDLKMFIYLTKERATA